MQVWGLSPHKTLTPRTELHETLSFLAPCILSEPQMNRLSTSGTQ